jgi:hypothetical protein
MNGAQCNGAVLGLLLVLAGCGGGGSSGAPDRFSLGGTATGLVGTVALQNNGGDALTLSAAGPFAFNTWLKRGATYRVTVSAQPVGQTCSVTQGEGAVTGDVTSIAVSCAPNALTLTGSNPVAGAINVEPGSSVTLTFSVALANAPAAPSVVRLSAGGGDDPLIASYSANQLVVTPRYPLGLASNYSLDVSTDIRGAGGGQLAASLTLPFTTRDGHWRAPDTLGSAIDSGVSRPGITRPGVGVDATGNAIVVWSQLSSTGRYDVWANRYVLGVGWGVSARIETDNLGDALDARVAVSADGNAIAVWLQSDNVWVNHFTPAGGWSAPQLLETESGRVDVARLSMNFRGDAVVAWRQRDGTTYDAWANRYIVGAGWQGATRLELTNGDVNSDLCVAVGEDSSAFVVWGRGSSIDSSLWANQYVPGGGWEGPVLVESEAGGSTNPAIVVDSQGNAIVAWQQLLPSGIRTDVWANRFVVGSGWAGATMIELSTVGNAGVPRLAVDGAGNVTAVFTQRVGPTDRVWANRYVVGAGWGVAIAVDSGLNDTTLPAVAVDARGNAVAAWFTGTGSIFMNRFLAPTASWGTEAQISSDSIFGDVPTIAVGPGGVGIVSWTSTTVVDGVEGRLLSVARFD